MLSNNLHLPQVRDVVENNEDRLKLINTGVKTFVKYEDKGSRCDYRLAQVCFF